MALPGTISHLRHFRIAGITLRVESDLPITDETFHPKFRPFETGKAGRDIVCVRHCFDPPRSVNTDWGEEIYRAAPWAIFRHNGTWRYRGIGPDGRDGPLHFLAECREGHTRTRVYHRSKRLFKKGRLSSLTGFPTDQVVLARVLADRKGGYYHAGGIRLNNRGLMFLGHSGAGKSTMVRMCRHTARILCDDRVIVRKWDAGFKIHGSWSHGDVSEVSPESAGLAAVLFLEKASENRLVPITDKQEILRRLLACMIKPLTTVSWWHQMLDFTEALMGAVPFYTVRFDRSGGVVDLLGSV